jgi:hypothetical protein
MGLHPFDSWDLNKRESCYQGKLAFPEARVSDPRVISCRPHRGRLQSGYRTFS